MATSVKPGKSRSFLIEPAVTRLAAAVLAASLLGWSSVKATRRAAVATAELRRAQATLATFADLRRRYEPAVAAESIAWRRTWIELRALGVVGDARLATTQDVARAADEAGLRDVKVLIGPSDTTGAEARLSTEEVQRKPASFSLLVESRGSLRSIIGFLGHLPPSVAATGLSLVRQDVPAGRHRISLAVYELTIPNGPAIPTLQSSVERRDTGSRAGDGPGG